MTTCDHCDNLETRAPMHTAENRYDAMCRLLKIGRNLKSPACDPPNFEPWVVDGKAMVHVL